MSSLALSLAVPVSIEIEQVADLHRCYRVWCDYEGGGMEALNPINRGPDDDGYEYYVAGLRTAVKAAEMRWGRGLPVVLTRARHPDKTLRVAS